MKTAGRTQKSSEILIDATATSIPVAMDRSSTEDSNEGSAPNTVSNVTSMVRRGSGPRTTLGKERSKHNALKHGVFSKVVLLKDEPKAEFDSLLNGLRESFQPEGSLEDVLVEKLATLLWRQRRVLIAEGAEIRKGAEFLEWNQQMKDRAEARKSISSSLFESDERQVGRSENSHVLTQCVRRLGELRDNIKQNGFSPENDEAILEGLRGEYLEDPSEESLSQAYVTWQGTSEISEEERKSGAYATPEDCKNYVLERIDHEIRWLKKFQKEHEVIAKSRLEIDKLRQHVPDDPRAERLLRYEASLERAFDRTLSQLERLQRMRKGQLIPPPIKVDVSS